MAFRPSPDVLRRALALTWLPTQNARGLVSSALHSSAQRSFATKSSAAPALNTCVDELLPAALNYAMMHGLVYADKEPQGDASRASQCPLALLPLKVPAHAFHKAVSLSPLWGLLVDAVARDTEWLYATLEETARADPFTGRLVEICKTVHGEGVRQKLCLGVHRSDYMIHEPEGSSLADARFLQVELNTIASSFGALSSKTTDLHRFLLTRYGRTGRDSNSAGNALQEHFGLSSVNELVARLPENVTLKEIPDSFAKAHSLYGVDEAIVLFVVQEGERNYADQRWLEYNLWERHQVRVLRRTLREVQEQGILDASSGRLTIDGAEVAVAYFRAGYTPDDYHSETEWEGRLLLERSLAIKSPSVAYQLVGAKKIQQALATPGVVEKFIGADVGKTLRECFAGLWGMGRGEDDAEILSKATTSPHLYVMKPQREGGGNNFYGDAIPGKLKDMSEEERGAFIMMQRILPKTQDAVLTRMGGAMVTPTLSEFGFYNVFIGDGQDVFLNNHAGHLIRTKPDGVDEGGVAAGYAMLNSPFLVE